MLNGGGMQAMSSVSICRFKDVCICSLAIEKCRIATSCKFTARRDNLTRLLWRFPSMFQKKFDPEFLVRIMLITSGLYISLPMQAAMGWSVYLPAALITLCLCVGRVIWRMQSQGEVRHLVSERILGSVTWKDVMIYACATVTPLVNIAVVFCALVAFGTWVACYFWKFVERLLHRLDKPIKRG